MLKPTLLIKKKKVFDSKGWSRYYGKFKLDLNIYSINTEAALCKFIYQNMGEGHYMILAWKKKRKGFWVFWKGDIDKEGFISERKKVMDNKEIQALKDELEETKEYEEQKFISELIEEEVNNIKGKKYGFCPYLKPSANRGSFFYWEDE